MVEYKDTAIRNKATEVRGKECDTATCEFEKDKV